MPARDGYSNIFGALVVALLVSVGAYYMDHWFSYVLYAAAVLLVAFMLFFFRDPEREITEGDGYILSPADGNVVLVKEVDETHYIKGRATQISIFLSPLDVHINRSPVTGLLEYVKYQPGKYLMAWDHRASDLNERADFGVRHETGRKVFFRQITGFLARRIVYHIKEGDRLKAGERFGMMKFGSRMDILVPADAEIHIAEGDRAVAGETILATIDRE